MTVSAVKLGIVWVVIAASIATPMVIHHHAEAGLHQRKAARGRQAGQLTELIAENERLSSLAAQAKPSLSDEQSRELMRLRGEVGMLRRQTNWIQQLREENRRLTARLATAQNPPTQLTRAELDEKLSTETVEAMGSVCRELMTALRRYANDHTNRAPDSLFQLRNYFSASEGPMVGLYSLEFVPEQVPIAVPAGSLILRESGLHRKPDGKWARFYAYGDGRVVEATSEDGNFDAWEKHHLISSASPGQ